MAMTFERIFNPTPLRRLWKRLFPSKEMRVYRRMHRKHKRELMKLAKKVHEWDYGWIDELVLTQIKHMYEYFSASNNVWQTDETRLPIVEQLKHVIDLYEELDGLWGKNKDYMDSLKRERELYEEIYSYVGCHIKEWWD